MSANTQSMAGVRITKPDGKLVDFDFENKVKHTYSPAVTIAGVNFPETFIGAEPMIGTEIALLQLIGFMK